ncbi:PASTA domain-containing protein [Saccharothrix longispora]|uniref:non-specific serine/threonine protein kinase n=1 Tax=Saccharothrix longispora TaxID=33920 RepID=A0ABU1Q7L7_9PSEU|nr:PASTA domain-containing protein [Saccharothrix longispora]MDR6598883.1 serine/threonine-protein kinase [Saccharothrix longispora]
MERSATNVIGGLLEQRYRVGALVARGGMSSVYRGVDTRLERAVAIKVMDPRFSADPQFVARFEREARAAAKLHHPGVVQVHDQGVDEDRVFLVMELVEGGTLRDLLNERRVLDVPLALTVLEKVLSPLAAAHRADLVHRDVKPENVLIGRGGAVKVADFGLVRAVSTAGVTSDSVILGTVAYLSPEQVTTGNTDARSDVYSAGVLLYEMLTGTPPYVGDNAISVAYRHVNDEVPPVPDVPAEVAELVRRATRKEPFLRPANAESFLAEVEAVRARLGMVSADVPVPAAASPADPAAEAGPSADGRTVLHPITPQPTAFVEPGTRQIPAPGPAEQTVRVQPVRVGAAVGTAFADPTVPVHRPNPLVTPATGPQGTRAIPRGAFQPVPPVEAPRTAPRPRPRPRRAPKKKTPEQLQAEMQARGKRQLITVISVVAVATLLVGVTTWWFTIGRVTNVPELVGQREDTAIALITGASLKHTVRRENSDTVPAGEVISADPPAGTETTRGELVRVVVSAGKPVVPQVQSGVEVAAAEQEIRSVGLQPKVDPTKESFSDRVPKGKVVTLDPAPGTPVPIGSTVSIVLSKGPQPKPVPSVTGKSKDEAFGELSAAGFDPVEGPAEFSESVDAGKVVRTDPGAGSNVSGTDRRVTVFLSNAVTVPQVEGKRVKEAKEALEKAGLKVDVQFNGRDRAKVVNQSVRAGQRVPKDTQITLIAL